MRKVWSDEAWEDYLYWQTQDKKTLRKINELIKDIDRNGLQGIGKSEPLKYRSGWSRRIDKTNRLVFDIKDDELLIASCRGHYLTDSLTGILKESTDLDQVKAERLKAKYNS